MSASRLGGVTDSQPERIAYERQYMLRSLFTQISRSDVGFFLEQYGITLDELLQLPPEVSFAILRSRKDFCYFCSLLESISEGYWLLDQSQSYDSKLGFQKFLQCSIDIQKLLMEKPYKYASIFKHFPLEQFFQLDAKVHSVIHEYPANFGQMLLSVDWKDFQNLDVEMQLMIAKKSCDFFHFFSRIPLAQFRTFDPKLIRQIANNPTGYNSFFGIINYDIFRNFSNEMKDLISQNPLGYRFLLDPVTGIRADTFFDIPEDVREELIAAPLQYGNLFKKMRYEYFLNLSKEVRRVISQDENRGEHAFSSDEDLVHFAALGEAEKVQWIQRFSRPLIVLKKA